MIVKYHLSDEHIFVIGSWTDTIEKESTLIKCISKLREFNIPILLITHYNVEEYIIKMVDYYIFDKNNSLLTYDKYAELGVNSLRWTQMENYRVNNLVDFHHDFAILENIKTAFEYCDKLEKKKIHYIEYDNIVDTKQYYESFLTDINYYDSVFYEYHKGSIAENYCAAYMFSIRTEVAMKFITEITTLENHFRNSDWRLENFIINRVNKYSSNYKISQYVDNDNTINTQAVWSRDEISRNGAYFQIYLAVYNDDLYVHFISGFYQKKADKDYLIEIKYKEYNKFYTLRKNIFELVKIGKYNKGDNVVIKYQGICVFNQTLTDELDVFRQKNYVSFS